MSYGDKQRETLQGVIGGLMRELGKLAPHPDRPNSKNPLSLIANNAFKQPAEYDGMLGSLILEGFLGTAFLQVANDHSWSPLVASVDWSNILDAYSEYLKDREDAPKGEGKGSLATTPHGASKAFNAEAKKDAMWDAYTADLPRRRRIEKHLAAAAAELNILEAESFAPALAA